VKVLQIFRCLKILQNLIMTPDSDDSPEAKPTLEA